MEREGGALLFHRMSHPIDITKSSREMPSPLAYVDQARRQHPGVWIDIEKPFWWDVPVWLSSGKMQSIGVANNHMWRSRMLPTEAWGRVRDDERLPPPLGNGFWMQEIYYHILNTGIRIPPQLAARQACWAIRWVTTVCTCISTANLANRPDGTAWPRGGIS